MEKAAGHLEGSSLPVGGENTHAVITAHRGLPSAALFTDLDKMKKGDHFLLHVLDDTLCYEVDQISTIEPKETDALSVEEGMDLVTLVTCTPYGVNSHRLLVRGHRVPYDPQALEDEEIPLGNMSLHTNYILWIVAGLLVTGIFSFFLYIREKKLRRSGTMTTAEEIDGIIRTGAGIEEFKESEKELSETEGLHASEEMMGAEESGNETAADTGEKQEE